MKIMKKAFSVLMALLLILALSTASFAAEPKAVQKGSITIENPVRNETYTLYRIFDLDGTKLQNSEYSFTVNTKWADFFKEGAEGRNYVEIGSDGKSVTKWLDNASAAIEYAKNNNIANDGSKQANDGNLEADGTLKFADLDLGYYLVQSTTGALCSLDSAVPDVTVTEKNENPSVDKEVQEDSDSSWGNHNDADIEQVVNFRTTIEVKDPDPKNYRLYDKMSDGLTFDDKSVIVKVNGTKLDESNNTWRLSKKPADGYTYTFGVIFLKNVLKSGDVVTIEYSATVNENAVIAGEGNPNETWLKYGNENETEHDTTRTYVWKAKVFKYTDSKGNETPLKGARFVLYKNVEGVKNYATAGADNKITGWTADGIKPANPDSTKKYATEFTTPDSGRFSVTGLDADTYYLKEIAAPDGYNKLKEPIKVVITAEVDETTKEGTATITYNDTSTGEIKVWNKKGAELPSTGGMGTTLFYVIGAVLLIGSGVLLVTRRRMGKPEN